MHVPVLWHRSSILLVLAALVGCGGLGAHEDGRFREVQWSDVDADDATSLSDADEMAAINSAAVADTPQPAAAGEETGVSVAPERNDPKDPTPEETRIAMREAVELARAAVSANPDGQTSHPLAGETVTEPGAAEDSKDPAAVEQLARIVGPLPPEASAFPAADPGAGTVPPSVEVTPPAEPRTITLLVPEQTFTPEGPDEALRVSYDDLDLLKVLNMEPVPVNARDYFPQWLTDLDGQRIRIRGFMYPPFQDTDLPGFVLARDNQICCFGRNPKIYDLIEVSMRAGETTDYINGRPFDVVGQFHIVPEAEDGELYQFYQIDDAVVIDR
jgi:hypothetical protein